MRHLIDPMLHGFSEKQTDYMRYKSRVNAQRHLLSVEDKLAKALAIAEAERAAKEAERTAKEAERTAKEAALAEADALRARLRAAGIDPDDR